jgi:hypothetical protein
MKNALLPTLLLAASVSLMGLRHVNAEPPKVDGVEDLLHQAETAANPVPLLEKAKDEFAKFKAAPNNGKMAGQGVGAKKRAGIDAGAHKNKEEAMHAIEEALNAAKAAAAAPAANPNALGTAMDSPGTDLKAKIENAASKVHLAGDLKH